MRRRGGSLLVIVCLAALAIAAPARSAEYPTRNVRILVPYGPGSATDIVARIVADHLGQKLGQNFIVENKTGAFGILAIQELARSKPDGYTLMVGNVSTNVITPLLYPQKMTIDYDKTIVPVTRLTYFPAFLLAARTATFAPKNAAEFVDYARKHPGELRYATTGVGSFPQFDMVMFARKAGIEMVDVPFKGGPGEAINAMATGDVHAAFLNVASTEGMIKSGHLTPLAAVSAKRLPDYPDLPTMAEIGYAGIGTEQWNGLFARAGTPAELLDLLYAGTVEALRSEQARKVFQPASINAAPSSSMAEAATWLPTETEKWRKIIAEANIRLDE